MNQNSVNIVSYFNQVLESNWVDGFTLKAKSVAEKYKRKISHFDFRTLDKTGPRKGYKFIKRNFKYLNEKGFGSKVESLCYYCLNEGEVYFDSPLTFVIRPCRENKTYGVLIIQIHTKLFTQEISENYFDILSDIRANIGTQYAFVHIMQNEKYPVLYFLDAPYSSKLNDNERNMAGIWERNGYRFPSILRDIFWGNIICRTHWKGDKKKEIYLLTELKHECKGNIHWIDPDTLYFQAPFDICFHDDPKMLDFRERLYKVFDNCGVEIIGRSA
jgi:hypothetical protein